MTGSVGCPECGYEKSFVKDSRSVKNSGIPTRRRTRECDSCGTRFSTFEFTQAGVIASKAEARKAIIIRILRELPATFSNAELIKILTDKGAS